MKTYKVTYIKGNSELCEKLVTVYGDINIAIQSLNNTGDWVGYADILKIELVSIIK